MLTPDPDELPLDGATWDTDDEQDHLPGLLELTAGFFRQASPQVRAELALFLTTRHGWHAKTGLDAYLDILEFTAHGLRTTPPSRRE
ncbi:hypothetical protein NLX83_21600 [Allokutzneria sp. A3M-2-11 16]|uniref:hypothetical protein n=1 Tax=Pseudonocardiaceae TaxID=2070 RepID=UPI001FFF3530|nr:MULTISPECIES: hypothetical protein [Pseudonocardiaceae]MCK2238243.1 hypothetical protein [Crossiella sp. S99.2]MCK2256283.1 hypothetical protein [Crossiella sp. S99.1]MCP3801865.1 hypothetical protein [Allokutzneria sp. A3M-2-11 16]